jgi:hypothetical protein
MQSVTCDNNDGFQHLSFHIFTKICFISLKDYLTKELTLR